MNETEQAGMASTFDVVAAELAVPELVPIAEFLQQSLPFNELSKGDLYSSFLLVYDLPDFVWHITSVLFHKCKIWREIQHALQISYS